MKLINKWMILLIVLVVGGGCESSEPVQENKEASKKDESKSVENQDKNIEDFITRYSQKLVPVASKVIEEKKVVSYFVTTSFLEPVESIALNIKYGEQVSEVLKTAGEPVKKGDLIAKISSESLLNEYKKGQLEVEESKRPYEANRSLYKKQLIAKEEWEKSKYRYQSAKLKLEEIKQRLDKLDVVSPINGVISKNILTKFLNISSIKEQAIEIVNSSSLKGEIHVPIFYLSKIKVNHLVNLETRGKQYLGYIDVIYPTVQKETGTVKMVFKVDNSSLDLIAGEPVDVKIPLDQGKQKLVLPENSVFFEGTKAYVYSYRETTGDEAKKDFEAFMDTLSKSKKPKAKAKGDEKVVETKVEDKKKPELNTDQLAKIKSVKRVEKIAVEIEQLPGGQYALADNKNQKLDKGKPIIIIGLSQINDGTKVEVLQ